MVSAVRNRRCPWKLELYVSCASLDWASEASPTWMVHMRFFIYYILSYVRWGLCDPPFFFFFGMRCAQYKVHAQCSFTALAPHMPCMLLVGEDCSIGGAICVRV